MTSVFNSLKFPELFIGFVAPIGADIDPTVQSFRAYFERRRYRVIEIKVTDIFKLLDKYIPPKRDLVKSPLFDRYEAYINYGDLLREHFDDDEILSKFTIQRIIRARLRIKYDDDGEKFTRTVFLLHQFKRKEEIDLLRSVYGRLFFQVSLYSRRGSRVDFLSRRFASSANVAGSNQYRAKAEKLIQEDENEISADHGQRVAKIFHDADFLVNLDASFSQSEQVNRFCELLFSSNSISPTRIEYGMFLAKAAALRTLDLSRQVGAAIFSCDGEIISLGSNEVPKAGGGTYWSGEGPDDRDYVRGHDSNDTRKKELLSEIVNIIDPTIDIENIITDKRIKDSQFMDALEYGRIVHAEMSALSDAARVGTSVRNGVLYCTTFPCHMCAKHIVAAGVSRVVFLEPYPKSLAFDLHTDSLRIEGSDRGSFQEYPSVIFEHFYGVSPRRYREIFERGSRKQNGKFKKYNTDIPAPFVDVKYPFYSELENLALKSLTVKFDKSDFNEGLDDMDRGAASVGA